MWKMSFLCVLLGIISGCAYGEHQQIGTGRYEIKSGGMGHDAKWLEEAKMVCPKGFAVVERGKCESGPDCVRGTVKCD